MPARRAGKDGMLRLALDWAGGFCRRVDTPPRAAPSGAIHVAEIPRHWQINLTGDTIWDIIPIIGRSHRRLPPPRHGATGGGELVQKAINEVVPNRVDVDGVIGPKTVGAYAELAGDPAARRRLLDALGNERQNKLGKGKETARIDHFRFQNDSGSTGSK